MATLFTLPRWEYITAGLILTLIFSVIASLVLSKYKFKRLTENYNAMMKLDNSRRIPVTIVTGFLGSGKTVLLNNVLRNPRGKRICVIENEIGAVSIDHELLKSTRKGADNTEIMVMKNGCMCCTTNGSGDELISTLDRLVGLSNAVESEGTEGFDYVIIETSGMVDPAPIINTFYNSGLRNSRFFLDSVITVVDSKNMGHHLTDESKLFSSRREAAQQIAFADVLFLNKCDISTEEQQRVAAEAIRAINPTALMIPTVKCRCSFDMAAFARDWQIPSPSSTKSPSGPQQGSHAGDVNAVTILLENKVVPLHLLLPWLEKVSSKHWQDLYRIKGLFHVLRDDDALESGPVESEGASSTPTASESSKSHENASNADKQEVESEKSGKKKPVLFVVHGVHTELEGMYLEDVMKDGHNGCNSGDDDCDLSVERTPSSESSGAEGSKEEADKLHSVRRGRKNSEVFQEEIDRMSEHVPRTGLVFIGRGLESSGIREEFLQEIMPYCKENDALSSHSHDRSPGHSHDIDCGCTGESSNQDSTLSKPGIRRRKQ